MNVHQKGKNIHSQQQQQPQPQSGPPSYPNQQSRPNATYHFDDASQKYPYGYGGSYVGGTGGWLVRVPPRVPLVSGLPGPNPPIAAPNSPPTVTQPRESSGASRRARSSALRLVDPNTNRNVPKKVPPSAVVTPTTSPEIGAPGVVSAQVEAADEVEATATSPFFSETEDIVSTPSNNTNVPLIEKIKAEEKTVPTVVASPTPSVPAAVTAPVEATPIIAVPVTQQNGQVPSSRDSPNNITMTAFLPMNFPANLKSIQPYLEMATDYASVDPCISYWCRLYALEQGFLLKRKEENLPFLLDLMQILGKNKLELQSKIETTDIPIARAYLEDVAQKLLNWAESAPVLVSFTDVVKKAFHTARMLLDVCSIFGESSEDQAKKCTDLANLYSEFHSGVPESAKSTSLKPTCKAVSTDQWSPVNPQGKKTYGRNFLLELQNSPACQKKPEGLARLEIVRDKATKMKRGVTVGDFTPPFVKTMPATGANLELDFLSKIDSIPRSSGSVGKSNSSATPASQVNIDFQHSLEKYLRDATHLTTDEVCNWIQKQYVGDVNPAFIRALGTAVTESSIEGRGTDSKLNNIVLIKWTEVLRCYVGNIPDRELQLLYAVQTLVTKRQHPKGLIEGIFETLYDSSVVSEEGFETWVSVDDPLEREGKAVALKMITSFLTRLKKADP